MEWTNGIGSDEALEDGGVEAMWDSAAWPDVGVGNDAGSELELMFVSVMPSHLTHASNQTRRRNDRKMRRLETTRR